MSKNKNENNKPNSTRKEFSEIKEFLSEHVSSQIDINSKLQARLETMSMKMERLTKMRGQVKILVEKYKEQRAQIDILVKILSGRFQKEKCECGRPTFETVRLQNLQAEDSNVNSENRPDQTNASSNFESSVFSEVFSVLSPPESQKICNPSNDHYSDTASNTDRFTYSEDQKLRAKKTEPKYYKDDPVDILNSRGQWIYKPSQIDKNLWKQITKRRKGTILSNLLLLPQELSGLTIWCILCGVEKNNKDEEFYLSISSPPFVKENLRVPLPVEFNLQVKLKLLNGEYFTSEKSRFKICELNEMAESGGFFMPFKYSDRKKLPEMIFKFSK